VTGQTLTQLFCQMEIPCDEPGVSIKNIMKSR
jgi:hypothetical protein